MRRLALVLLFCGCGSVSTSSALTAADGGPKEAGGPEHPTVERPDVGVAADDGGVDAEGLEAGTGPFGGLHTVDVPAYRNEPPMQGGWVMTIAGSCSGRLALAATPNGHGWDLAGTWTCGLAGPGITSGAVAGDHDWTTDVVHLTLMGESLEGAVLTLTGAGQFVVKGTLGDAAFTATH